MSREPARVLATPRRRAAPRPAVVRLTESPWFDVVESKLRVPVPRPGTVSRTGLVNRLRVTGSFPVLTVTAPAGYGKTTLLAQWAARDARPFAWVSLDEADNDPVVLLRHLATAIDRLDALDAALLDSLKSPGRSLWTRVVPRLGAALAAREEPFVIVLDDAHLLRSRTATRAVSMLVDHVAAGSILALSGRTRPRLPLANLRARGRLLELDAEDLALQQGQASVLLANAGAALPAEEVEEIVGRTEGWPAGLYLAALSRSEPLTFSGEERFVADYFRSECLAGLAGEHLAFLRRTAVLETMCAPLCDAVVERTDSARVLEWLERSGLFLVPLDRNRRWYRYHRLFRDLLSRELAEAEPELMPTLHRRAADWLESNGNSEAAIRHAEEAGDSDRVARLVAAASLPAYHDGRLATIEGWLNRFDAAEVERYPAVALIGGWVHAVRGRTIDAERWLEAAEASPSAGAAVLRAALCRDGVEQMLRDTESGLAELPSESRWRPTALLLQGCALVLLGDEDGGDAALAATVEAAQSAGTTDTHVLALGQRSLLAAGRGDAALAESLAREAHELIELARLGGYATSALVLAAWARASLRHGSWDEARACLTAAALLTASLTDALPWLAVQARLELARTHLALREEERARTLVAEADVILGRRTRLGVLGAQANELRRQVDVIPAAENGKASGLTGAELRLLPLLATHLSFREIGERLHVSRNTVKTQAISVYRKLGVSSRSEAIDHAARLGLLEATPGA